MLSPHLEREGWVVVHVTFPGPGRCPWRVNGAILPAANHWELL